jgi:hypothetical protein
MYQLPQGLQLTADKLTAGPTLLEALQDLITGMLPGTMPHMSPCHCKLTRWHLLGHQIVQNIDSLAAAQEEARCQARHMRRDKLRKALAFQQHDGGDAVPSNSTDDDSADDDSTLASIDSDFYTYELADHAVDNDCMDDLPADPNDFLAAPSLPSISTDA